MINQEGTWISTPDKLKQLVARKPKDWKWKDADQLREGLNTPDTISMVGAASLFLTF